MSDPKLAPAAHQETPEPPTYYEPRQGVRILRISRDGSWLEESEEGQRTRRSFPIGAPARAAEWQPLTYERLDSKALQASIRLHGDERLLVLQPFGWHIDGHHIPNAAEHFSREGVCEDHGWKVVDDYGPYVAIVKPLPPLRPHG